MVENNSPKDIIEKELKKEQPDWHLIEKLSRDEVDSDPENVRFSVDAAHIHRLGFELVAKQETALAELIKNSYDADATKVTVDFIEHDKKGGTLVIEDNGAGMTLSVIREAWMRLSTANKMNSPISPRYGRIRAGRKGIGRFAAQRLGEILVMETEVSGSSIGLRVIFEWDNLFDAGRNLNDIFNSVEKYEKPFEREKTILKIIGLRESWSPAALQRVWKTILLLQPPFMVARRLASRDDLFHEEDPGFEVVVNGTSSKNHQIKLGIDTGFLNYALAEVTGEIYSDGSAKAVLRSEKLGLNEEHFFSEKFLLTGPVSFSAKYFIYSPAMLSGMSLSIAQDMGREYGGVRIYRNGFRVLPYGERADDWLKLDRDTSRRVLLVPANNVNFFGQVELDGEENSLFEETSSREGLIENEAFEELRSFSRSILNWATLRVAAVRGRKQTAGQKDFVSTARPRKPSEVIGSLLSSFTPEPSTDANGEEGVQSGNAQGARPSNEESIQPGSSPSFLSAAQIALATAQEEVVAWERDVEARESAALQYEEMLRILASLGLSISVFGHEVKGTRGAIAAYMAVMSEEIDELAASPQKSNLENNIVSLKQVTGRMFDLGGYIAGLMSSTESRELKPLSVKGAIERFVEQFRQYMERQKIQFELDVAPDLRTIEMHASEIDSVLLNFLTNSIKFMKKAKVHPRRIRIFARKDGDFAVIGFEDNGVGINQDDRERIFDAFFTTSAEGEDDVVAGPGTGLGLKIVNDIALSYGGYAVVGTPTAGYTCCLEFRVLSDKKK